MNKKYVFLNTGIWPLLFFLLLPDKANAQKDSVIFKNGNTMVGTIKSLTNGVLTMGTSYSETDFTIKWTQVKELYSKTRYLITLSDGRRINGEINSDSSNHFNISDDQNQVITVAPDDIVFIKGLKESFWSRMNASVDVGVSFTQANHLRQYSIRSAVGYMADRWQLAMNFNTLHSAQDSISPTKRTDAGIDYKYFLQRDWFLASSVSFLSNTEQALKLRTTGKIGAGKMIIHTNESYWGIGSGISFLNETFTNGTESRNSWEAYLGTEINFFATSKLTFMSTWYGYVSLTESGRWRTDFQLDAKYKFWKKMYARVGVTLNYDNQPAVKGNETDYVTQFTVGWEL